MLLKPVLRSFTHCRNGVPVNEGSYYISTGVKHLQIGLKSRSCSTGASKLSSSQANQETQKSHEVPKEFIPEEVVERIHTVRDLDLTEKAHLQPVKSLGIKHQVERIQKNGSFVKRLFIGKFDTDFLAYPEILKTRKEFNEIQKQCEMIEKYFRKFLTNQDALHKLGFERLWRFTATEMMTVFESIGHAMHIKIEDCNTVKALSEDDQRQLKGEMIVKSESHPLFKIKNLHALFNLLNHNCLGFGSVEYGDSDPIRDRIIELLRKNPGIKIGFAWTERQPPFGAGSFADWDTVASRSSDGDAWVINGSKNRILKDDYDYYAIFCKTHDYTDDERPQWMIKGDGEAPPGIVGFLVPADRIGKIEDEEVVNGLIYQRITFDSLVLPTVDHLLVDPSPLGIRSLNIRGLGLLGTSATILGMLKALLQDCYTYLIKERPPLLECQTIERILCDITNKIYALESSLYLTSQAYDSFDNIGADPEQNLEAAICKVLAVETAHEVIEQIQSVYGSQMLITTPLHDFIHALDSYLDNSVHHRVSLGQNGMWLAGYHKDTRIRKLRLAPFFPLYRLKDMFMERQLGKEKPKLIFDLRGHVHPSLAEQADKLETLVHKFGLGCEWILGRWAKKTPRRQNDLERVAEMAIDIYIMTCTLSRASKAYCDACKNAELDRYTAISVIDKYYEKGILFFEELNRSQTDTFEYRNQHVHRKNIEYGGFFAQSALHKIHY